MTVIAGRYRLLDVLGQGGMGTVWRARDETLGRDVAVKEVRAPAGLSGTDEQRLYARLEREAWAAARITHRNVVTVYDVATEDGRPWIVMELIHGLTLSDVLEAEGPMPPRRAALIGAEVLATLRAAHEAGVLHRDVKPGNVLLSNDGRVVLTDFGIAAVEGTSPLTMTGELIGSPEFLAPERALGRTPGPASDLWSLGVLLYAAVEGSSPFRQDTPLTTLRAVVDEELPPPRRAGALAPVIEGLLRKDPHDRLQADVAERQLRLVGAGGSPRSGPVRSEPYGAGARPSDDEPDRAAPTSRPAPTPTPPLPLPLPLPSPGSGGSPDHPGSQERSGRAVAVLAAGVVLLLLAVGALTYALLRNEGGGGTGGHPATSSPATGTPSTGPPTTATTTAPTPTGTTATATTTAPPAPTVLVYVRAVRGSYSGPCPPAEDRAPAFAATLTVGRTPASVEYRWVTESGETSAEKGWRTLEFVADGPREKTVEHTELTHRADETRRDRIRMEVRAPAEKRSNWVEFSVTCGEATPTGGATSPSEPNEPNEPNGPNGSNGSNGSATPQP